MAICFITHVNNYHSSEILRFRVRDYGRHPKVENTGHVMGADEWMDVLPGQELEFSNFGIPWNMNNQHLTIEWTKENGRVIAGKGYFVVGNIEGWDYVHIRDAEHREIRTIEVGSLGDAPGINYSTWRLALHSNGLPELTCTGRDGLSLETLRHVGAASLEIGKDILGIVIENLTKGVVEGLKA